MNTLEKRLVVLEQAAKLLAARPNQHISSASIEEMQRRFTEILTRPCPEKTLEERRFEAALGFGAGRVRGYVVN